MFKLVGSREKLTVSFYASTVIPSNYQHCLSDTSWDVFLIAMEKTVRQLRGIFPPVFEEVCRGFKPLIKTSRLLHCCSKLSVVATRA